MTLRGHVTIRAYGPLGDFLPPARRGRSFERAIDGSPSVKDVIEAAGIPHPEVGLVLVDGEPVGFERRVAPGERVAVYPPFRSIDLAGTGRQTAAPPGSSEPSGLRVPSEPTLDPSDDARFVLDGHLGRLAAYLRMCGLDTWYRRDADDDELAEVAATERRILLTRDRGLLKRSIVERGAFVRSDRPTEQLAEILDRFDLAPVVRPFSRCLRCNALLEPIERSAAAPLVPPRVRREQAEFRVCPSCKRLYWRGSHHRRMEALIASVLQAGAPGPGEA